MWVWISPAPCSAHSRANSLPAWRVSNIQEIPDHLFYPTWALAPCCLTRTHRQFQSHPWWLLSACLSYRQIFSRCASRSTQFRPRMSTWHAKGASFDKDTRSHGRIAKLTTQSKPLSPLLPPDCKIFTPMRICWLRLLRCNSPAAHLYRTLYLCRCAWPSQYSSIAFRRDWREAPYFYSLGSTWWWQAWSSSYGSHDSRASCFWWLPPWTISCRVVFSQHRAITFASLLVCSYLASASPRAAWPLSLLLCSHFYIKLWVSHWIAALAQLCSPLSYCCFEFGKWFTHPTITASIGEAALCGSLHLCPCAALFTSVRLWYPLFTVSVCSEVRCYSTCLPFSIFSVPLLPPCPSLMPASPFSLSPHWQL